MNNKVFVGNLPWRITSDELTILLQDQGYKIRSARVIIDHDTKKSRGFAFVEFETPAAAAEAMGELDGYVIDGRPLRANVAVDRPRGSRNDGGGGSREREHERERDAERNRGRRRGRAGSRDEDFFRND